MLQFYLRQELDPPAHCHALRWTAACWTLPALLERVSSLRISTRRS